MDIPEHMQVLASHAHYAPHGKVTLPEGVEFITRAIRFTRHQKIDRLLVDTTGLDGFPPPLIYERYWFAIEWAHEAKGTMIIAFVALPEMIDPQRFGVLTAHNAGLKCFVSASEDEARTWLLTEKTV
jgi:hypothetical protein